MGPGAGAGRVLFRTGDDLGLAVPPPVEVGDVLEGPIRSVQQTPGRPKSARVSEVVYGVKVLEKMLDGPPPRVDPQAVAKPAPKSSPM